jgi:hypothetical protein
MILEIYKMLLQRAKGVSAKEWIVLKIEDP